MCPYGENSFKAIELFYGWICGGVCRKDDGLHIEPSMGLVFA